MGCETQRRRQPQIHLVARSFRVSLVCLARPTVSKCTNKKRKYKKKKKKKKNKVDVIITTIVKFG